MSGAIGGIFTTTSHAEARQRLGQVADMNGTCRSLRLQPLGTGGVRRSVGYGNAVACRERPVAT